MTKTRRSDSKRNQSELQEKLQGKVRSHAYLRVAESIRLRILANDLKPGDRLPNENDLAQEEGVGRTTVREALRLLASVGLIETKRGLRGGAFVTHPSADDLVGQMTTALSLMARNGEMDAEALSEAIAFTMPLVARIASLRGTDEEIATLLRLSSALPKTKTDVEWSAIAHKFSALLIDMARNRVLAILLKPLMWAASTVSEEGGNLPSRRKIPGWKKATANRYQEVVDAVKRRAPAAAEEAMILLRQQYIPRRSTGTLIGGAEAADDANE